MENISHWVSHMLKLGEYRGRIDACFIPNCDGRTAVRLKGIRSGESIAYCINCAFELLKTRLFELDLN